MEGPGRPAAAAAQLASQALLEARPQVNIGELIRNYENYCTKRVRSPGGSYSWVKCGHGEMEMIDTDGEACSFNRIRMKYGYTSEADARLHFHKKCSAPPPCQPEEEAPPARPEQGSERLDESLGAPSASLVEVKSPEGTDITSYAYVLVRGSHEGILEVLMTEEKVGGRLDVPKSRAGDGQKPEETARRTLRFKARWRPPIHVGHPFEENCYPIEGGAKTKRVVYFLVRA